MLKLGKISNLPVKLAESYFSQLFSFCYFKLKENCFAAYKTIRNANTLQYFYFFTLSSFYSIKFKLAIYGKGLDNRWQSNVWLVIYFIV